MITVIKAGGSLFDLPDLGVRLRRFLAGIEGAHLFPGGGAAADVVREWDAIHKLGEEESHWLAVKSLALSGSLLKSLVHDAVIVDVEDWLRKNDTVPHSWSVTTDSLAAHYARTMNAKELIILKSTDVADDLSEAAKLGQVDPLFPSLAADLPVRFVNLRNFA